MITKEDFEIFKRFYREAVYNRAYHIAQIFKDYDEDFATAHWWDLEEDKDTESGFRVYCDSCGFFGDSTCSYDAKWLWATDGELRQHVQSILDERQREKEERERQEQAEEAERQRKNTEYLKNLCKMSKEDLLRKWGVPENMIKESNND